MKRPRALAAAAMHLPKRIALLSAAAVVVLGSLGICASATASAATSAPVANVTKVIPAKGSILCGGDLCIQTDSINANSATIEAWAYTYTFGGHFEMITPAGQVFNSPTKVWTAGGAGYDFHVPLFCYETYTAIAWAGPGKHGYTNIGEVSFGIHC